MSEYLRETWFVLANSSIALHVFDKKKITQLITVSQIASVDLIFLRY